MTSNQAKADAGIRPSAKTTPIRRIVTGHDENGKAIFIEDQICPNRFAMGGNPDFVDNEMWVLHETPGDNECEYTDPATSFNFVPPQNGNIFRILEIAPDSTIEGDILMHRTASLDYAVVLKGEVYAILDDVETLMKPLDVMIQRGTIHAWSNRTDEQALVLFVLNGAKEIEGLEVL